MDYKKLIDEGIYSKDMLSESDKLFIEGMEYIRDNVLTKDFISEGDIDDSFSLTFAKISKEILDNIISTLRDFTEMEICEAIVSFIDESESDETDDNKCNVQQTFKKTKSGLEIVPEAIYHMRYHDLKEIVDFISKFKSDDLPAGISDRLPTWKEFLVDNY